MEIIGLIAEYNPFHNGHLYQIKKIKEMYPNSLIIVVVSSSFLERGEVSIINKWDKTTIALDNGIDIVIELPFVYSSQASDIFAKASLTILNAMKCQRIIFGSESNNIEDLKTIAKSQINNKKLDTNVKKYLKEGISYPTALSRAIKEETNLEIKEPNDLLAISYIKEILKNKYKIIPTSIKRTNNYHDLNTDSNIISAQSIRNLLKQNKNITPYVPKNVSNKIYQEINYFNLLKYKIITTPNLKDYQTVDEGLDSRLKKYINKASNLEELINLVKSKRYTYNKINRMFIHILCQLDKKTAKNDLTYIRILGFNKKGKTYLNEIKKDCPIKIITSYKNNHDQTLNFEYQVTQIYSLIVNDPSLISKELKKPIIK